MKPSLRKCRVCGQEKAEDEFAPGRGSECRDCVRERSRRYREAGKAANHRSGPQPGVITLKEAARLCQEMTGYKISASYIRSQAYNFPQIAAWDTRSNGGNKLTGILKDRLTGLVRGRQAARGRFAELKDIFSTADV